MRQQLDTAAFIALRETNFSSPPARSVSREDSRRVELRAFGRQNDEAELIPDRLDPVLDIVGAVHLNQLARGPKSIAIAEAMLQKEAQLFRCKFIRKTPNTHGYILHADYPYWEVFENERQIHIGAENYVTLLIAIDEAPLESGPLEVYPGTHRENFGRDPTEPRDIDSQALADRDPVAIPLDSGDVVAFHSQIAHQSEPNRSRQSRRVLISAYVPKEHMCGELYDEYYRWYLRYSSPPRSEQP